MAIGEKFLRTKYKSDAGGVYSIRISVDSNTANAGGAAIGAYTDKKVKVTVGDHDNRRKNGLHARGLKVGLPATAPATGYTAQSFIPILQPFGAEFQAGEFITYQGEQWEIINRVSET